MEVNDIDVINAQVMTETTFPPRLIAYFVDKNTNQFYVFNKTPSPESIQDLYGRTITIEELIVSDFGNKLDCEEVSHQEIIEKFEGNKSIKKYITSYIRDEKLNKLIN